MFFLWRMLIAVTVSQFIVDSMSPFAICDISESVYGLCFRS